jgi:DNA-binding NtrC family response regulator
VSDQNVEDLPHFTHSFCQSPGKIPKYMSAKVLIVDDENMQRCMLAEMLSGAGFEVEVAGDGQEALACVAANAPDVVLSDLVMPRMDGFELLARLREVGASIPVIVLTGFGSTERAVSVVHDLKAFWFLEKPVQLNTLLRLMERAMEQRRLVLQTERLSRDLAIHGVLGSLVGISKAMQGVFSMIAQVAPSTAAVLISGESGTGKELVAREIHRLSSRASGPFVAINCAALPETLIESELFGHERGAFTGAFERRVGCFEQAHGGTLFLDEIGEMPQVTQAKLLRVLDNLKVRRLGSPVEIATNVRILAATNRALESVVKERTLREDLYYRLNVFRIHLTPLRERKEDITPISEAILRTLNLKHGATITGIEQEALDLLLKHDWPGNVRELRNVLERAVLLAGSGPVTAKCVRLPEVQRSSGKTDETLALRPGLPLRQAMQDYIEFTLKYAANNRRKAATILGISLQTLHNRLAGAAQDGSRAAEAGK